MGMVGLCPRCSRGQRGDIPDIPDPQEIGDTAGWAGATRATEVASPLGHLSVRAVPQGLHNHPHPGDPRAAAGEGPGHFPELFQAGTPCAEGTFSSSREKAQKCPQKPRKCPQSPGADTVGTHSSSK